MLDTADATHTIRLQATNGTDAEIEAIPLIVETLGGEDGEYDSDDPLYNLHSIHILHVTEEWQIDSEDARIQTEADAAVARYRARRDESVRKNELAEYQQLQRKLRESGQIE